MRFHACETMMTGIRTETPSMIKEHFFLVAGLLSLSCSNTNKTIAPQTATEGIITLRTYDHSIDRDVPSNDAVNS